MAKFSELDYFLVQKAVDQALTAEVQGNLPVGAIIAIGDNIISSGKNAVLVPYYHPGRHAEIEALRQVDHKWWPQARNITCYTTLEPCMMCMGALLLHGIGRVVFGAIDPLGGAGQVLSSLPKYYDQAAVPEWLGPVMPEICDDLYRRATKCFDRLPCGKNPQ